MKYIKLKTLFFLSLLLLLPSKIKAEGLKDLFDSDRVIEEISKTNKPLVFTDETYRDYDGTTQEVRTGVSVPFQYLGNRRALTGRNCGINRIINTVDVGSGQKDLDKVVNDDLNDYGEFISTVSVSLTYSPLVSIKDASCYYAKGTTAGYCIISGGGSTVLSLDLIKALSISFYRDGKLIETVPVSEGQDGAGINLSLVNIPGSDGAGTCLSATAPCVFDEISLDINGGLNIGVGQLYRVKYAFVGDAREFTITENKQNGSIVTSKTELTPFQKYDDANKYVDLDYMKGWNPVLLGIPLPLLNSEIRKMTNEDLEDYASITPIVGLAYKGGAKFMMKDQNNSKREVYEPGTEVGFCYTFAMAASIDLGNSIEIILFDRNGNKVQTESISSSVLGLSVGNGGKGSSCITSKVPFSGAEIRFYGGLSINIGVIGVHYAFVREKPDIRHNCLINPSADISLCDEQTSYQLMSNPEIPVKWTFEKFIPADEDDEEEYELTVRVTEGGYVTGLSEPGQYIFRATAADGCSEIVIINYSMFPKPEDIETQGDALVNGDGFEGNYVLTSLSGSQTAGGLLIIDNIENPENVLDGTYDATTGTSGLNKYAEYGGLKVAENNLVLGIKRTDANIIDYERDHEKEEYKNGSRVGFVVSSNVTGLNLSVLSFWNIRCLKDGEVVYNHVVDESNAISAGLGGQDGPKQTRYAITVPWIDNNKNHMQVDEIQLWSSGVLDLSGQQLNIYYAFVEGEAEDGGNPLNCSATVISTATTGAAIDYSLLGSNSLIQALGALDNIMNFVDDDPKLETSLSETHVAGVAARVIIPVKLGRTVDFRNSIGIVTRSDTYLLDLSAGKGMTIYTMYQGEKTGDEFTTWGILGADVAGYGDKQIYYIHPTRICDEIVIDFGNGITTEHPQFFGLFLRTDSDADGIPDCQDPCSCFSDVSDIQPDNVCEGMKIVIDATGIPGTNYRVQFNDPAAIEEYQDKLVENKKDIIEITATQESNNNIHLEYTTKKPGRYQLTFYNGEGQTVGTSTYYVHPLETEWRTNAASTDWTNWSNWSKGTPYCCTNVIIPSDAINYPILSQDNEVGDEFCCNNIFIRPGAFIGSVNKLNYKKAWVQMELSPNCYNLLAAPLKGMVTGDMFIPADKKGVDDPDVLFEAYRPEENRFNPTIYQRLWYSSAKEQKGSSLENLEGLEEIEGMNFTKWSKNFNHVNTLYTSGMGFSMWVDNGNLSEDTDFRFTFPKENSTYKYFDDFTQQPVNPGVTETIRRSDMGRFIYETGEPEKTFPYTNFDSEEEIRKLYGIPENVEINVQESTDYFLFGNPFMSPINAREFILENIDVIKGITTYDGNATSTLEYDEVKKTFTPSDIEIIPPMTSVFVIAKDDTQSNLSITLDETMIDADYWVQNESEPAEGIQIRASANNLTSSMVALTDSEIKNNALFDNEVAPRLAIFSNVDGEACDIVSAMDDIPLTIIADKSMEITLEFLTYGVDREEWKLVDIAAGTEYPLDSEVILPVGTGTSSGRFHLRKTNTTPSGIDDVVEGTGNIFLNVDGYDIVATATEGNLISMEVFDLSGSNVATTRASQPVLSARVNPGIYVVRVASESGVTSHKILVR